MSETVGDHLHGHSGQQEVRGMNVPKVVESCHRKGRDIWRKVALYARMVFAMSAVMLSGLIGTSSPEVNTWPVSVQTSPRQLGWDPGFREAIGFRSQGGTSSIIK
ncbi:MAG TPA: hypothetical protein VF391_11410 [Dermatophilaceae bacterium]